MQSLTIISCKVTRYNICKDIYTMRKMHLIWHMRVSLIFAPCGTITWGERGWAPHSTNSLPPCDCATYANMRDSLICHMRCISLYLYFYCKHLSHIVVVLSWQW